LDYSKHYIGERTGVKLDPLSSKNDFVDVDSNFKPEKPHHITLPSSGSTSSAVRVISTVKQVYDLFINLLDYYDHIRTLKKFRFILDWHQFSDSVKIEKFSKWGCHELNLFLYEKDKPFFDTVVLPYLKVKLKKILNFKYFSFMLILFSSFFHFHVYRIG
jgi:hypothetical protein